MNQDPNNDIHIRKSKVKTYSTGRGSILGGLILIVVGGYFLGRQLGWFDWSFPFWAVIIIVVGIWLIAGGIRKKKE